MFWSTCRPFQIVYEGEIWWLLTVTLWERVYFRIINTRPKPSRIKNGQSQAEQKNSLLERAWLVGPITITYHYLESLEKNTYSPTITKKSQYEIFIWPYAHQLFTKLFLKDATFLHIVAVMSTLPNVKHDETLSEEALLFIFSCNFKTY